MFSRPRDRKNTACSHDAPFLDQKVAVGERQRATHLLHIRMYLDPIAKTSRAGVVDRQAGCNHQNGVFPSKRGTVSKRHISETAEHTSVHRSARIAVLLFGPYAQDQAFPGFLVVDRPQQLQVRAASKNRLKSLWQIAHRTFPANLAHSAKRTPSHSQRRLDDTMRLVLTDWSLR